GRPADPRAVPGVRHFSRVRIVAPGRSHAKLAGVARPRPASRPADSGIHRPLAAAARLAGPPARPGPPDGAVGPGIDLPPLPRSRGMTVALARKLLRDVRLGLIIIMVLLMGFQCLWAKVADRIVQIIAELGKKNIPI